MPSYVKMCRIKVAALADKAIPNVQAVRDKEMQEAFDKTVEDQLKTRKYFFFGPKTTTEEAREIAHFNRNKFSEYRYNQKIHKFQWLLDASRTTHCEMILSIEDHHDLSYWAERDTS